jgi:hypothetical protein
MDRKIALFIGTRVVDDRGFGGLFLEATGAGALVLNLHLAFRAFEIACEMIGDCKSVGHRKGEQEQQKRGKNSFHDRGLMHSENELHGVN